MTRGDLPTTLPFIHREAVKALKTTYPSQDAAAGDISRMLREFYVTQGRLPAGRGPDIDRAVLAVQDVYRRNVFPDMKVTFGTYPNNIGHVDFPGCFRCHDDDHKSKDGKKIGYPGLTAGVAVDPATGDVYMVVCDQGLWKSTDAGSTFARIERQRICEWTSFARDDSSHSCVSCSASSYRPCKKTAFESS